MERPSFPCPLSQDLYPLSNAPPPLTSCASFAMTFPSFLESKSAASADKD